MLIALFIIIFLGGGAMEMFTDEDFRPSGRTPVCWMYQRLPFFFHVPWPKLPSESNTQERICLAAESQPMICIPAMSMRSRIWMVKARTMKLLFLVQWHCVTTVASSS